MVETINFISKLPSKCSENSYHKLQIFILHSNETSPQSSKNQSLAVKSLKEKLVIEDKIREKKKMLPRKPMHKLPTYKFYTFNVM